MQAFGFQGVTWLCAKVIPKSKLTPTLHFQCENVEPNHASASLILKMAIAVSIETLDQLHHIMRLNPYSRNLTLMKVVVDGVGARGDAVG
jgi:hypothetical protein